MKTIKTKFKVGDLAEIADLKKPIGYSFVKIIEIQTQTCYAGTQVFYACRVFNVSKGFPYRKDDDYEITPVLKEGAFPWAKIREDELKLITKELKEVLNENK